MSHKKKRRKGVLVVLLIAVAVVLGSVAYLAGRKNYHRVILVSSERGTPESENYFNGVETFIGSLSEFKDKVILPLRNPFIIEFWPGVPREYADALAALLQEKYHITNWGRVIIRHLIFDI